MSRSKLRLLWVIPCLLLAWGLYSYSRLEKSTEETKVKLDFESCKTALLNHQTNVAMGYFSHNAYDYLNRLNSSIGSSPAPIAAVAEKDDTPGVDLLLRTALEKKVPADLRPNLTLDTLMQRITDKRLLDLRSVKQINLGRITVKGNSASAEINYQGMLTALYLHFVKEDNVWKIDLLAIFPYGEFLMRVDRAYTRQTEEQQVDQLVSKLPSL